jgi:Flp pilus assembly pilin Flp
MEPDGFAHAVAVRVAPLRSHAEGDCPRNAASWDNREGNMKLNDEAGASLVEYALLLSLITAVAVGIVQAIGGFTTLFFNLGGVLNP